MTSIVKIYTSNLIKSKSTNSNFSFFFLFKSGKLGRKKGYISSNKQGVGFSTTNSNQELQYKINKPYIGNGSKNNPILLKGPHKAVYKTKPTGESISKPLTPKQMPLNNAH
jgi:hypothetical protein